MESLHHQPIQYSSHLQKRFESKKVKIIKYIITIINHRHHYCKLYNHHILHDNTKVQSIKLRQPVKIYKPDCFLKDVDELKHRVATPENTNPWKVITKPGEKQS